MEEVSILIASSLSSVPQVGPSLASSFVGALTLSLGVISMVHAPLTTTAMMQIYEP